MGQIPHIPKAYKHRLHEYYAHKLIDLLLDTKCITPTTHMEAINRIHFEGFIHKPVIPNAVP